LLKSLRSYKLGYFVVALGGSIMERRVTNTKERIASNFQKLKTKNFCFGRKNNNSTSSD